MAALMFEATPNLSRVTFLQNEAEYKATVAAVERLFGAEPGSEKAKQFVHLAALVEAYENQHHTIEAPSSNAAKQYELERRNQEAA